MRLIINNGKNVVRIILAQRFQLLQHAICCIDNIRTTGLIHLQRYRLVAINTAIGHSTFILGLHVGHLPQLDVSAACTLKLQMLNLLRSLILRLQTHCFFQRIGIDGAGRNNDVFLAHRRTNILQRQSVIIELILIYLDSDFLGSTAGNINIGYAGCLLQALLKAAVCQGKNIVQVILGRCCNLDNRIFLGGTLEHCRLINILRQIFADTADLFGCLNRHHISIGLTIQLDKNLRTSWTSSGTHLLEVRNRGQLVLNRLRHLLLDGFRTGTRIVDNDADKFRVHVRQQLHANAKEADKTEDAD